MVDMNKRELADSTHFQDSLVGLVTIFELKDGGRDDNLGLVGSKSEFDLLFLPLMQNNYKKVG